MTEPVENEDIATFTCAFKSGAAGTFSVPRVAVGLPNSLGFEIFSESGAAQFDLARTGEFVFADQAPAHAVNGYRRVLVGPEHPYIAGGLSMDFPSVNYGQSDLFAFQARAFFEQVAAFAGLPPCPAFEDGVHNLKLLAAVAASAKARGTTVHIE